MIGADEFAAASDDAVVVNVSRGPVLDADALLEALSADGLRAAGLDVTDPEPLPPDSPLWDRRDVLITPHCAGYSDKYPERFLDRFVAQYDRWTGDGELRDRIV
jgi:D-2-hydroxyacid dehydrogenase (NADP+)